MKYPPGKIALNVPLPWIKEFLKIGQTVSCITAATARGGKKDIKIVYKFPKAFYPSKTAQAVECLLDKYKVSESVIKC